MSEPLKAWWWKKHANFGDALTPHILAHVSGRKVAWEYSSDAEIISIGSVMEAVRNRVLEQKTPVYVWGTGMMYPIERDFLDLAAISAVRGPITAGILELDDIAIGDPALLTNMVFDVGDVDVRYDVGIIAHWTHQDQALIEHLQSELSNAVFIPMQTTDVEETTRQIASCKIILSSSLHGLIVADSLGVPNFWLDTGSIHHNGRFKFFDYGLSVGRLLNKPYAAAEILKTGFPQINTHYFNGLDAIKKNIIAAFPQELAA